MDLATILASLRTSHNGGRTGEGVSVCAALQALRDQLLAAQRPSAVLEKLPELGHFFSAAVEALVLWKPPSATSTTTNASASSPRQAHVLLLEALLAFGQCCQLPRGTCDEDADAAEEIAVVRRWVQLLLRTSVLPASADDDAADTTDDEAWQSLLQPDTHKRVPIAVLAALRLALLRHLCRLLQAADNTATLLHLCATAAPAMAARGAVDAVARETAQQAVAAARRIVDLKFGAVAPGALQKALQPCLVAAGGLARLQQSSQLDYYSLALGAPLTDAVAAAQAYNTPPGRWCSLSDIRRNLRQLPAVRSLVGDGLALDELTARLQLWSGDSPEKDETIAVYCRRRAAWALWSAVSDTAEDPAWGGPSVLPLSEWPEFYNVVHLHRQAWHDVLAKPAGGASPRSTPTLFRTWQLILSLDSTEDLTACARAIEAALTADGVTPDMALDACEVLFAARLQSATGSGGWNDATAASTLRVAETLCVGLREHGSASGLLTWGKQLVAHVQEQFCALYEE